MKENKWLYNGEFKEMQGIILTSRSGGRNSGAQRNPDYKLLLQYVVETLKNKAAKNVEIYIASNGKTKYPNLSDRLLSIDGEYKIDFTKVEADDFISKLSKQIRLSGQLGTEKGGNSTKKLFFQVKEDMASIVSVVANEQKVNSPVKEQVLNALKNFKFEFKRPKKGDRGVLKALVTDLQNSLKNYLETTFANFDWQIEYKSATTRNDSFDIYGYDKIGDMHIVIELDPHRADSISKKFVSRLAMMSDKNLLYVAYLYPGTDSMPKSEADKYLQDCETILNVLSANSGVEKQFLGFYLES